MSSERAPYLLLGVPAYNEAGIIAESITRLIATLSDAPFSWQIVVLNNASTDDTAAIAMSVADPRVTVLPVPEKGKGHAVRAGARMAMDANHGVYAFIDADLSADPSHISEFVAHVQEGEAEVVVGSRLLDKSTVDRGMFRTLTSETLRLMRYIVLDIPVVDSQCGLKVMNRRGMDVLVSGMEGGWFWDMEFLAHAARSNLGIREIPVRWDEFRFPGRTSKLKVVRDGVRALTTMLRIKARMLRFR